MIKGGSKKVKTKKQSKIVALMLSASMAMTALATNVHAEEAEVTNVWKMGNKTYESLQAAVDETSDQAATIELLKDASGNGIRIPGGKNITIDFGGHAYDVTGELVGSTGTVSQAFQLLKGSNITLKNGEIKSAVALMLVQNYANLTVDGMKLDGSSLKANDPAYTLSNNCGNVVIKDTEIIAKTGGFAFDVYYWPKNGYGEGVSVTVEGNSVITGNVEYDSDGTADGIQNIAEKAKITIKGGSFSGEFLTSGLNDDGDTGISISGGNFKVKPDENYLAEGFHLNENGTVLKDGTEEKEALSALKAAIAAADEAFDENTTYTAESKEAFDKAYANATAAAKKENASIAELKEATDALIEATNNLEEAPKTDLKNQLADKINYAETKLSDGNTYTEESLKALNDALAAAKELGDDADDEAIQTALDDLTAAIDNLQLEETPTLDLSKLKETIEAAKTMLQEAIDSGLYTPESLTALEAAIAAAEKLCEEVTTQALIDQEVQALEAAMKGFGLIEEPDPNKPDNKPENQPTIKPETKPENKPASDPKKDNSVIKDSAAETPNTGDSTTALVYILLLAGAGACLGFAYMRKGNNA